MYVYKFTLDYIVARITRLVKYLKVDPNGYGRIGAMEAARFLKKSQLSDVVLSKIWDMADPQSRGSLDKSGLFVALKLCALAQAGRDLSMSNLNIELPPPKMVNCYILFNT